MRRRSRIPFSVENFAHLVEIVEREIVVRLLAEIGSRLLTEIGARLLASVHLGDLVA